MPLVEWCGGGASGINAPLWKSECSSRKWLYFGRPASGFKGGYRISELGGGGIWLTVKYYNGPHPHAFA